MCSKIIPNKLELFSRFEPHTACGFFCGAGGIRTLVQTSSQKAFYMLSLLLIVGKLAGKRHPTNNLIFFI